MPVSSDMAAAETQRGLSRPSCPVGEHADGLGRDTGGSTCSSVHQRRHTACKGQLQHYRHKDGDRDSEEVIERSTTLSSGPAPMCQTLNLGAEVAHALPKQISSPARTPGPSCHLMAGNTLNKRLTLGLLAALALAGAAFPLLLTGRGQRVSLGMPHCLLCQDHSLGDASPQWNTS